MHCTCTGKRHAIKKTRCALLTCRLNAHEHFACTKRLSRVHTGSQRKTAHGARGAAGSARCLAYCKHVMIIIIIIIMIYYASCQHKLKTYIGYIKSQQEMNTKSRYSHTHAITHKTTSTHKRTDRLKTQCLQRPIG